MSFSGLEIRLADLDALQDPLDALDARLGLLSAEECAWGEPLQNDVRRRRRTTRIALRALLMRAGAAEAQGRPLVADSHGKPTLGGSGLAFNVSHSGGMALIAVAAKGPLGVDLEGPRKVALGQSRQTLIEAAGTAMARDGARGGFLAAWTRMEAFAKARGTGVGALLTELGITARGVKEASAADVEARAATVVANAGLRVVALDLPQALLGAVCGPADVVAGAAWQWLSVADLAT